MATGSLHSALLPDRVTVHRGAVHSPPPQPSHVGGGVSLSLGNDPLLSSSGSILLLPTSP